MGKFKEIEFMIVGSEGFESVTDVGSPQKIPVRSFDAFMSEDAQEPLGLEIQGIQVYGLLAQFAFQEIK